MKRGAIGKFLLRRDSPFPLSDLSDWRSRSFLGDSRSLLIGGSVRKIHHRRRRESRSEITLGRDWLGGWEIWKFGKKLGLRARVDEERVAQTLDLIGVRTGGLGDKEKSL